MQFAAENLKVCQPQDDFRKFLELPLYFLVENSSQRNPFSGTRHIARRRHKFFTAIRCGWSGHNSQESSAKLTNQHLAMRLPLAFLVSMPVIFCLLPSSSIVILVFYLFLQASVNSMYENCECEYSPLV